MPLITRVSRLFRADLHAVLDRLEEPDVLLRHAVREMEEALAQDERRLRLLEHDHEQLTTRIRDLEEALRQAEGELDVCFEAEKHDLARTLIRRRLELQGHQRILARKSDGAKAQRVALASRVEENRRYLESMRQKAELLADDDTRSAPQETVKAPDLGVRDEDVEVAFLRELKRRKQV